MNLAGGHPFYDAAAFWPVATGIVVGLLTIAATVWVTLRAANPKRRLYYWMPTDTPLITRRQDLSHELKVTYGTRELDSPRVVNVRLTSRGRRDIAREAFDGGEPLRLDLGTPIVECVKVSTSPSDRPDPSYALDGSKLLIGPSHFGRRQTTIFSLLVDGKIPEIVKPQQSLIDVQIRQGYPGYTAGRQQLLLAIAMIAMVTGLAALAATLNGTAQLAASAATAIGLTIAATVSATFLIARWDRAQPGE